MNDQLVVGTVRAIRNDRHVVVRRDGSTVDVVFEGDGIPRMGGDVIGVLRTDDDGIHRMTLKRSVSEALLEGKTRISAAGTRPDLTARLLAKVLARSRSAMIAAGSGVAIERSPTTEDPDLGWAMSMFRPEADRLAIAMNVIDVQAVSRAPWRPSTLHDLTLPADLEGNGQAMRDLTRLLRSGFHPDCNRMIEQISGMREISVNFVIPYSPFSGALGFAREVSNMDRGYFPTVDMTISEARRISSARHLALSLAHASLGAAAGTQANPEQSPRAAHMANCFADAAAALAFLASGGRREAMTAYADLKESSLHFGRRPGGNDLRRDVLGEATHRAIRAALEPAVIARAITPAAIVAEAVRIARRAALPASRFQGEVSVATADEARSAARVAAGVGIGLREAPQSDLGHFSEVYRREVRSLAKDHSVSDLSASRFMAFGAMHVPLRFADVFDEETRALPRVVAAPKKESVVSVLSDPARLARRVRARTSIRPPSEDDALEFDGPLGP